MDVRSCRGLSLHPRPSLCALSPGSHPAEEPFAVTPPRLSLQVGMLVHSPASGRLGGVGSHLTPGASAYGPQTF